MLFEFDPNKSRANLLKHGIDFVAGQALFTDPRAIRHVRETKHNGEAYWKAIDQARGRLWALIYVQRGEEKEQYEIE